ncbi:chitinase [Microbulbifer hydrolyticus]|nr:chitinase [Microbulbifer hydrolyticus]MBB5212719.1 chitinase [Microbulbifer hydrolyticus]
MQYVAGTSYAAGELVQNVGLEFQCNIAGWCSSAAAWAYEPGVGMHWEDAWSQAGDCGSSSSSSSSSGGSSSSSSSSGSSSSGGSSGGSSSGGNSGLLPKHALVGYWHNFDNGSGLYRISEVSDVWDVIVVAFVDDAGNGNIAFNLDPGLDKQQFIDDIAAKRAAGKIVVASYGGEKGTVTLNTEENVTNFVNSTAAMIDEYGFDGIDIDLESGAGVMHGAPVIQNMVNAVKQLKQRYPGMYLSMAPEHPYVQGGYVSYTGIWGAYLPMIDQLRDELDLLHVQLYNNGGLATPYQGPAYAAGSVDMMVSSALMLIEGFPLGYGNAGFFDGLRPDQVGLALPSGPSAAGSGFATTADINRALDCLTQQLNCDTLTPSQAYPTFNGVMTWSINWDMNDGGIFSGPVGSHVHNLP